MDKELISAILDGESSAEEMNHWFGPHRGDKSLAADEAATMRRFGIIGQAIRQESGVADAGFSARVLAACAAGQAPSAPVAEPSPFESRRSGYGAARRRRARWLPAAGVAAAASVAVIAVLAVRPAAETPARAPVEVAQVLTSPPQAVPVAAIDGARRAAVRTLSPQARPRISSYVMDYSNSRATNGFSTPLGYARLAAYTGARNGETR